MSTDYFTTKLPAELRNNIYELLLQFEAPLSQRTGNRAAADTSILVVTKQIHSEAVGLFFDFNTFILTHDDVCLLKPLDNNTRDTSSSPGAPDAGTPRQPSWPGVPKIMACAKSIKFTENKREGSWTDCEECGKRLIPFTNHFAEAGFPQLRRLVINAELNSDSIRSDVFELSKVHDSSITWRNDGDDGLRLELATAEPFTICVVVRESRNSRTWERILLEESQVEQADFSLT